VSLSLANHHASLPVAYQLYLPQDWAEDDERRGQAGVPDDIIFKIKPETDPKNPPLRPERHIPNSIATMRKPSIDALAKGAAAISMLQSPPAKPGSRFMTP